VAAVLFVAAAAVLVVDGLVLLLVTVSWLRARAVRS
jgi:uncharacterized protein YjeT (DUF2065 family)